MNTTSYDYSRRAGVYPISWDHFHGICKALAEVVQPYAPQIILAVGRGGYYPGTLLAHMLRVELYPVRLSRRVGDVVTFDSPQWLLEPPALINGQRVLIVDEIASSGETLRMVAAKAAELGAEETRNAVLYAHSWGVEWANYIGLVSDALLLNPWDREILGPGGWQLHPEYVEALALQGQVFGPEMLIHTTPVQLAKGGSTT